MANYIQDPNDPKKQIPGPPPDNYYSRTSAPTTCTLTKTPNHVLITKTMTLPFGFFYGSSASFSNITATDAANYDSDWGLVTVGTKLDIHPTAWSGSSSDAGNILKELFKSGIKLGISSRGLGSVEEITEAEGDGYTDTTPSGDEEEAPTVAVQPDFELIAFDFVSNPSTQGAFMSPGQMKESIHEGLGTRKGMCTHDCKIESIINDIFRGE